MSKLLSLALKVGIVAVGYYVYLNWDFAEGQGPDAGNFAERNCGDEMRSRFDATAVNIYSIKENSNGFVVRASITLARGNTAKVICLTNSHGAVRDISVDEK